MEVIEVVYAGWWFDFHEVLAACSEVEGSIFWRLPLGMSDECLKVNAILKVYSSHGSGCGNRRTNNSYCL